jgi:hypothetical protein
MGGGDSLVVAVSTEVSSVSLFCACALDDVPTS